jgi:4-hydroxymandelate oxidase
VDALSLAELADAARERLDPVRYDYFAGGADDELTVRANEDVFTCLRLRPRVLRGSGGRTPAAVTLAGTPVSCPVLIAPTAFHRLAHPDGEVATARAAAATGTTMILSMASTVAVEEVAATGARLWFQLYLQPDRGFTAAVVKRAEAAGCQALVVTVDSPVFGRHVRDLRNGFTDLPTGFVCENMRDADGSVRDIEFAAGLGWADIDWLRSVTGLPVIVKGVLHPEDARLAVEHGVAAIIVSNHGGRQLDTAVTTLEALPAIADAVGERVPLVLDGGVRRGTDVVKACALGASAVAVGRPVVWGLALDGADGVEWVLSTLLAELDRALALCGADSVAALTPDLVVRQ